MMIRIMMLSVVVVFTVVSRLCHGFSASSLRRPSHLFDDLTTTTSRSSAVTTPFKSRRDVVFAIATGTCILVPALPVALVAAADPRATVTIHLDNSEQRAGLELYETTIGTRNVVAVRSVLSGGLASKAGIQPGMILLDYTDAKTVTERIKNGPYPLELRLYNLAAGGDAFGDLGKPLVTAEDALQMAKDTSTGSTVASDDGEGYVTRVRNKVSSCGMQSRRGDVLEIDYEARYGSKNGPIYDSSAQRGTGQPYQLVLGSGDMIPGVDLGLYDMCPGEERDLEIPPKLGYGDRGSKLFDIPGNARLYWSVKLVRVNSVGVGDERTRDEIEGRSW